MLILTFEGDKKFLSIRGLEPRTMQLVAQDIFLYSVCPGRCIGYNLLCRDRQLVRLLYITVMFGKCAEFLNVKGRSNYG